MATSFAITHLGYFPLRKEADHKSENVSQLLFGELFEVIESRGSWHYIRADFDDYEGWIDCAELYEISETEFLEIKKQRPVYSGGFFQQAGNETKRFTLGFGSRLPYWDGLGFRIGQETYGIKGEVFQSNPVLPGEYVIELAKKLLGTPYLWGGKSTFGIDCSGLVQNVFKYVNIHLPRDAWQQKGIGYEVPVEDATMADLAFFTNEQGRTSHVGILVDSNHIIHASGKVRIDEFNEKGIFNIERKVVTHRLEVVKRIR